MKRIFIINGSGGCGKDIFVSLVAKHLKPDTLVNFSSVDKVKEIAKSAGWLGGKSDKDRKFLSDLKKLCESYNDLPFQSMKAKVAEFNRSSATFLFLHIRESENIEVAKKAFNAWTILITNSNVVHITSNESDKRVYDYEYDFTIDNSGDLKTLDACAFEFVDLMTRLTDILRCSQEVRQQTLTL